MISLSISFLYCSFSFAQDSLIMIQDTIVQDTIKKMYILDKLDSANFLSENSGAKIIDCSIKGWQKSAIHHILQDSLQKNGKCRIPNSRMGTEHMFWFIIELPVKIHMNAFAFNTIGLHEDATLRWVTIETSGANAYKGYEKIAHDQLQKEKNYQIMTVETHNIRWIRITITSNWDHPKFTEIGRIYGYNDTSVDKYEEKLMENKKVEVFNIYFDNNSKELKAPSMPAINSISAMFKKHPEWQIKIEGHTDNIGDKTYNIKLSADRAETVRLILLENRCRK